MCRSVYWVDGRAGINHALILCHIQLAASGTNPIPKKQCILLLGRNAHKCGTIEGGTGPPPLLSSAFSPSHSLPLSCIPMGQDARDQPTRPMARRRYETRPRRGTQDAAWCPQRDMQSVSGEHTKPNVPSYTRNPKRLSGDVAAVDSDEELSCTIIEPSHTAAVQRTKALQSPEARCHADSGGAVMAAARC